MISSCCGAPGQVYSGDEGTNHFICIKCKEACDMVEKKRKTAKGEVLATGYMTFDKHGKVIGGWSDYAVMRGDIKVHVIRAEVKHETKTQEMEV